ncbi:uncharacterized protein ARMOST_04739 [Armillaria ostoyae]|uniref:Uncharacterized protein n=1 Tax=Armillaria ostoyae TaxID=47428 RepID=A0A284QY57_ARMOS|nr:uncharacterized protein ARMOST_04739 [Armillaria ostoyae]
MLSILAVDHLEGELAFAHEAQLRNKENDRVELAKAQAELEKLKMEDNSAAKMVSRYMKLSQAATNRLQASLIHEGKTCRDGQCFDHAEIHIVFSTRPVPHQYLKTEAYAGRSRWRRMIIREAFGHHREEFVWSLEKRASMSGFDGGRSVLKNGFSADLKGSSESMGQIVVAENAVETWVEELRLQTARRLELEKGNKRRPRGGEGIFGTRIPPGPIEDENHSQPSPRLASRSTFIVDELTSSESSSSSSTLITSDPVPFPTKYEPAELKQSTNNDQLLTEQLNDYAEDARVELEIRMALVHGFETVPGTLAGESPTLEEVEAQLTRSFPSVKKAQQNLSQKLDDMLLSSGLCMTWSFFRLYPSPSSSATGWMSWTSRPSSPFATTFGNVMMNPKLQQAQS